MRSPSSTIGHGAALAALAVAAFFAAASASTATAHPGILGPDESARTYGAQFNCPKGNTCNIKNVCTAKGCLGGYTCGPRGNTLCYQVLPNSMPSQGCVVSASGGTCTVTCFGGCYSYRSGVQNTISRTSPCSSACIGSGACGVPICTVTVTSSGGKGADSLYRTGTP